ncbi:MAG: diadenylate cyclase CdaA [Anaerolineales bacterium]
MPEFINNIATNIVFIFERLNWMSVVDLILVMAVFFGILLLLRGTQAMVLLRGALLLIALIGLLASLEVLPAFSWLVKVAFPAILLAIPVIFAPEIRHALERLGRAGTILPTNKSSKNMQDTINAIVYASARLSNRKHGALIAMQRRGSLKEYVQTGVYMNAVVSPELLLQVFYPNTPLHDGAVIISGSCLIAASCVMPLSASGVLTTSPERQMGLRHRAALGISEVSDAVAIVISEETGSITVVHSGRMIRRLDAERLENVLKAFFKPPQPSGLLGSVSRFFPGTGANDQKDS